MTWRSLRLSSLAALLAAAALAADAPAAPRLLLDGGGRPVLTRLPALLEDPSIRRHLDSGLTTSLVLQAKAPGTATGGAARVDVRLELWEEVYLVTVLEGDGRVERSRQSSIDELTRWWSEAEIALAAAPGGFAGARQARVSLAVVPFSQAELLDAQRWLVESVGQSQGGARSGRSGASASAVSALIATSMQRRAVRTVVWNVPIERRGGP